MIILTNLPIILFYRCMGYQLSVEDIWSSSFSLLVVQAKTWTPPPQSKSESGCYFKHIP
jgi:hypothetical protein